jgi:hypothetical protein
LHFLSFCVFFICSSFLTFTSLFAPTSFFDLSFDLCLNFLSIPLSFLFVPISLHVCSFLSMC